MDLNQNLPLDDTALKNFNKYTIEVNKVIQFLNLLKINLDGEIDFTIPNVKKDDITQILDDESKKRYVFLDKDLFIENNYDIYGEATVNLFSPSNYIHKFRQLIRYVLLIKLIENNTDYFKSKKKSTAKKAIMIVTDGKYDDFINKLSDSKIFSKDFEEKEFTSNSIDNIINCKKFKEELDDFENKIKYINDGKIKCNAVISDYAKNDYIGLKNEYYKEKNKYINDENLLKERTKNLLKFLKSSEIPFILCYFPKVGGEFPFDFFGNKPIILKKNKKGDNSYQYQFKFFDSKSFISQEELKDNYASKKEIEENYISKKEIEEKYLSIEKSNEMKVESDTLKAELNKTNEELAKTNKELADLKKMLGNIAEKYPGIKNIMEGNQ